MEGTSLADMFRPLLLCSSVFIVPLILGIVLLHHSQDSLSHMAGWLTLKPLLTTPLWVLILGLLYQTPMIGAFLSILPGALLSLLAARKYEDVLTGFRTHRIARQLLILDCVRWLNTLVIMVLAGGVVGPTTNGRVDYAPFLAALIIIGFALPSVFGAFAVYSLSRYEKTLAAPAWQKNGS